MKSTYLNTFAHFSSFLSLTSVHTGETVEWPHQQLGPVGVDTSAGVLVADNHLPAACQELSQVDKVLVVCELRTQAKLFAERRRQQSLLSSMADSQLKLT